MIIDYDHNPALTTDQKLQSLKESVQMALNEIEANNSPEQKSNNAKEIIESYTGSTLAGIAQSVKSAIDSISSRFASYVPTSRKVNNKALSSDITLTASDIGAETTTLTGYTVNSSIVSNPSTISVYRTGNVVEVVLWGTQFKTGITQNTELIDSLPLARHNATAYLALAGQNSYNIQGNIYTGGGLSAKVMVGLKSGYSASTNMYGSLTYLAHQA